MISRSLLFLLGLSLLPWTSTRAGRSPGGGAFPVPGPGSPGVFVPNRGQWDNPSLFAASFPGTRLYLLERGWVLAFPEGSLSFRFSGSKKSAAILPGERLSGVYNFFLGPDPARWRAKVPLFRSVRYKDIYPGMDALFLARKGRPALDLHLRPGADLALFSVSVRGARSVKPGPSGALVLGTPRGPVRLTPPLAWEILPGGKKRPVSCRWVLRGPNTFGLQAPGRDPSLAFLVDPSMLTGILLGTRGGQEVHAVAWGDPRTIYCAGWTDNPSFPTTEGAWDRTQNGDQDAFVACYSRARTLYFATFLGGAAMDRAWALAVDPEGGIIVGGETLSADFPTTPWAWDRKAGPKERGKAFLSRLDRTGGILISSTYLGGKGMECVRAVALTEKGHALVTGFTNSPDFPVTKGAFQKKPGGGFDIFVADFTPSVGSPVFSTLLGREKDEVPQSLLIDPEGNILIGGTTSSATLPWTGPQPKAKGGFDGLFVRMSPKADKVALAVRIGGSKDDQVLAMTRDPQSGDVYLGGRTSSPDFPATAQAFDRTFNACYETGWVARISAGDGHTIWAGILGGGHRDYVCGLGVDRKSRLWAAGGTESNDLLDQLGNHSHGGVDTFLCAIDETGRKVLHLRIQGGSQDDVPGAFAFSKRGSVLLGGWTWSADFSKISYPGVELKDGPWGFLLVQSLPKL